MKKTLSTMAAVAMMCAMLISGCNSPETQQVTPIGPGCCDTPFTLKGSIMGVVVDVRNNPVNGAVVTLKYPGGALNTSTDASGQYLFQNVPVAGQMDHTTSGVWIPGSGVPYIITVAPPEETAFVTAFTAALLDYATLAHQGAIDCFECDQPRAVQNLQVSAIPAVMPTATARVQARFQHMETQELLSGVLCTLSLDSYLVPDPVFIMNAERSVFAFPSNVTTSGAGGVCTFTQVPEGRDSYPETYYMTYSLAGFVPASSSKPSVDVGEGQGHLYVIDADSGDYDPMTAFKMIPGQPTVDEVDPFVAATSIPVGGEIAFGNLSESLTVTFNEAMDPVAGAASIEAVSFKNPGPVPVAQRWDAAALTLTIDPVDPLPQGMNLEVSLFNFQDVRQNVYAGLNPRGNADILTKNSAACTGILAQGVCVTVTTSGDPTLTQARNLVQVRNPADTAIGPFGGAANNIPQANNLNVLDPANTLGLCAGAACGLVAGETDTIFVSWQADPVGLTRQYEGYAELLTGGIIGGLPVKVFETAKSSNPPTAANVSLGAIEAAQIAAGIDPALRVSANNLGGLNFFDEGFSLEMAVIALNANAMRGPFSNVISANDNVPPTVADQGCGWDNSTVIGCGLAAPVSGAVETNLPIYLLTSGWGTGDVDLEILATRTGGGTSTTYDAADYTWFSGQGTTIVVGMSEDLDRTQIPLPALSANLSAGAAITGASIPGLTNSRRNIAIALSGAPLLSPGDTIAFASATAAILDEAGNAANATDATLVFADAVAPLITSAVASDRLIDDLQRLVIEFSEPMSTAAGSGDVEDAANYIFTGLGALDAVSYVAATRTATIVSDTDFQYQGLYVGFNPPVTAACPLVGCPTRIPGTNVLASTVEDVNGNVFGDGLVQFLVVDEIQPRILAALDNTGADVNGGASTWEVGDIHLANDPIGVELIVSEPVVRDVDGDAVWDSSDQIGSGISAAVLPAATYFSVANANMTVQQPNRVAFLILTNAATVANGDSIRLIATDYAGNSMKATHDRVVLAGGAGGGYNID